MMEKETESAETESGFQPSTSAADRLRLENSFGDSRPRRSFRLRRLALKELRETLRDRRTIVTLIVMPLLVYPILSLIFRSFLTSNAHLFGGGEPVTFQIVYTGDGTAEQTNQLLARIGGTVEIWERQAEDLGKPAADKSDDPSTIGALANSKRRPSEFVPFKNHSWVFVPPDSGSSVERIVADGHADLGVVFETQGRDAWGEGQIKLISRTDGPSRAAASYLQMNLDLFNKAALNDMLRRARLPSEPALKIVDQLLPLPDGVAADEGGGFSLASLIPLILVLMTITGAVYPAIDLTAGEKERGTLETLMAAPLPRLAILTAKFVAVLTVAVLTALLNMIGMAATIWVFQLDQFLPGSAGFTLAVVLKIFLLLVLFAAFYSALLLAVTSYARSFKEAQAYLIPIILLSMGPGLLAMTPGLSLAGPWAVAPMVNLLLLARDVIENKVEWVPALVAILSTATYGLLAMMWAARSFGSDAILYQTHGSFGEMFARPLKTRALVPLPVVMFCLVVLFPLNFVLIGILGRMPSDDATQLAVRFSLMGVFTVGSFLLFPLLVAIHQRTVIRSGFGLNFSRPVFWLAAVLLGISLWPIVMACISGWHDVYGWFAGAETRDAWHEQLVTETAAQVARVRQVSPIVIAICLAIIPAICEEWFFRGLLMRSLLRSRHAWAAILISAFVFGLFHVLSNSVIAIDRLLPTTLVGLMLGYLAYKSDSIFPGIVLHAIHNAAVVFLAYYQPTLSQYEWFPAEDDPIPGTWIMAGAFVSLVGLALVVWAKNTNEEETGIGSEHSPLPD